MVQSEFCKQIRESLVKSIASGETSRQRDFEARKADMFQKTVAAFKQRAEQDVLAYIKQLDWIMATVSEVRAAACRSSTGIIQVSL